MPLARLFDRLRKQVTPSPTARPSAPKSQAAIVEAVEPRVMLAGNVVATLRDGLLYLRGDSEGNQLSVDVARNGSVSFSSADGTTVNGAAADAVRFDGPVTSIVATLRDGDDRLTITDTGRNALPISGDVRVFGGRGADRIFVRGFDIGGELYLAGGYGSDRLLVEGTRVDGDVTLAGARGQDIVAARSITVGGRLLMSGGYAADTAYVDEGVTLGPDGTARVSSSAADGEDQEDLFGVPANNAPDFANNQPRLNVTTLTDGVLDNRFATIEGLTKAELDEYANERLAVNEVDFLAGFPEVNLDEFTNLSGGLRVRVIDEGTGDPANPEEVVNITYQGLLNDSGTSFRLPEPTAEGVRAPRNFHIDGLQTALGEIGEGGRIQVIVPPDLGFGNGDRSSIPGGSTLFFNLRVDDIERIEEFETGAATFATPATGEYPAVDFASFTETASGLRHRIIESGSATRPTLTDNIEIAYEGFVDGGEKFDSSYDRPGGRSTFLLDNLIAGWEEGLQLIGEGGVIQLLIPYELAYGTTGTGSIGPWENLLFNIELFEINPATS